MISLLFSLLVLPASAAISFGNGFVVGNGGDGYEVEEQVLLRDLLEAGISEPEIGFISQKHHLDRIQNHPWRLDFDADLLSRKISDLNTLVPLFGDAVLESLLAHELLPLQTKLARLNEGENLLDLPSEHLIQIANRLGAVIRIHQPSWNRMPQSHRVALLIHEALYSLVRLNCMAIGESEFTCLPDTRKVREITGRLFLAHRHESAIQLSREIDPSFRLPRRLEPNSSVWNPAAPSFLKLSRGALSVSEHMGAAGSPRPISTLARILCQQFERTGGFTGSGEQQAVLEITVNHPQPFFFTYLSPLGTQQAVKWSLEGQRFSPMVGLTKNDCEQRLVLEAARLRESRTN